MFKNLLGSDGTDLVLNYRPTQNLHGRKVYLNVGHLYEDKDEEVNRHNTASNNKIVLYNFKLLFPLCIYIIFNSLNSRL